MLKESIGFGCFLSVLRRSDDHEPKLLSCLRQFRSGAQFSTSWAVWIGTERRSWANEVLVHEIGLRSHSYSPFAG